MIPVMACVTDFTTLLSQNLNEIMWKESIQLAIIFFLKHLSAYNERNMQLRYPFYWDMTPYHWVISLRRFETTSWSHLQDRNVQQYLHTATLEEEGTVGHIAASDVTPQTRKQRP